MGRDEDRSSQDIEFFDADPISGVEQDAPSTPARRWPKWLPVLLVTLLAALVIALVVSVNSTPVAAPPTDPSTPIRSSTSASAPFASIAPITVTELAHPILGVSERWELFGRGAGVVVRIEFADGRITTTAIPALHSTGPVFFVMGDDAAIVRPLDFVPGYLVADGQPARQLPETLALGRNGPAFPGPDPDHVWVELPGDGSSDIGLVGLDDMRPGPLLPVPAGGSAQQATPDGAGYLLITGDGGTYDCRPDGLRRVTTGDVLAVGPTRWLVREPDSSGGSEIAVIDQASGARHVLDTGLGDTSVGSGLISPDGSAAALVVGSASPMVELLDLSSGAEHPLALPIDESAVGPGEPLAWSPDNQWLFAAAANGHLYAVNARTERVTDLSALAGLAPNLSQLAIRTAQAN